MGDNYQNKKKKSHTKSGLIKLGKAAAIIIGAIVLGKKKGESNSVKNNS